MPYSSITLKPGVNTIFTPTLNVAGISDSNLIRFKAGLPEKMGGWQRYVSNTMGSVTRSLHAWQDLQGDRWLSVGSLLSLKVIGAGGSIQDITPMTSTFSVAVNLSTTAGSKNVVIVDANLTSTVKTYQSVYFNTPVSVGGITLAGLYPISVGGSGSYTIVGSSPATSTVANGGAVPVFDTTATSTAVTVTFANHGMQVGEIFYFPIPTIVSNLTISGSYEIQSVTTNSFTISSNIAAATTATVSMNGGQAQYLYYLAAGPGGFSIRTGPPLAIGEGPIGEFRPGTGAISVQTGTTAITTSDWTQDNWGEILLACPKGGGIFYWAPGTGFTTAAIVGTGPPFSNYIFVAMPQQILVCLGSSNGYHNDPVNGNERQDPLLVRWSDKENFFDFTVSATTQAGSYRIPSGSELRGGLQAAHQALIWTDIDCWAMQYIGYPLVFGFNKIGTDCGLVGPHAAVSIRGGVYWMNESNFFVSDASGVRVLPCSVWDNVFQDLDTTNAHKVTAAKNTAFNEVTFFFPSVSGMTGENDKYVKFNILENVWDYGTIGRSAWIDQSILGKPIAADPSTTLLQQHEVGYNADGAAMEAFFETGYFTYQEGHDISFVDHFEPDAKWSTRNSTTSAQLEVTISTQIYPNQNVVTAPTLTMTSTTPYLSPRVRGRQMKWRVESNDLDSWWRWGLTRYRYGPMDGTR
jgi:hypothetical protein